MKISFDPRKRDLTLRERGLDFSDANKVFSGRYTVVEDDRVNYGERRYISAGFLDGRMVVLVWTPREEVRHIISMRYCHAKEEARWREHLG